MRLRHDNFEKGDKRKDDKSNEEKKRSFRFFKTAVDSLNQIKTILAVSVAATAIAVACGSPSKYQVGDARDTYEEVIDGDTVDAPDLPDVEPDTGIDSIDDPIPDTELDTIEDEVDAPSPTCFEIPTPIDPTTDSLLNNSSSQDAIFNNSGPESIGSDLVTNVSMTGYPTVLGVCPDDPDAVAFVAHPDSVISFSADVSMEGGISTWSAVIPEVSGEKCPELSPDSETLVAHNDTHQETPKNADMDGTMTHAGFDIMPVTSTLVAYDNDGVVGTDRDLTVTGSDFSAPNTIRAMVNDGSVDVEVEVRAGDSSETHTYTADITGTVSKQARVYATDGDQMYDVTLDTSAHTWCARCVGNESYDLEIPGDILCKILDECGCVGDGFGINVTDASVDVTLTPPHLIGLHGVSSPLDTTGTVGVTALSDPSTDHPSIHVILEKGSVGWDDGVIVQFDVIVNAELISEHENPDGGYDTRSFTLRIRVTDPWAWGSLSPNYDGVCGCTPVY